MHAIPAACPPAPGGSRTCWQQVLHTGAAERCLHITSKVGINQLRVPRHANAREQ
jgi:hypothetical protein